MANNWQSVELTGITMKRIYIFTLVLLTILTMNIKAGLGPQHKEQIEKYRLARESKKNIAYTIHIPGKDLGSGMSTEPKVFNIPIVGKEYYMPNRVHIKTRSKINQPKNAKGFSSSVIQTSVSGLGINNVKAPFYRYASGSLSRVDNHGLSRIYEMTYNSPVDPYDVCRELMKNPEVEYAVPVFIDYPVEYTPNDPEINRQWAVNNIQMNDAWEISKGSEETIIAIVDSGIDRFHPDLQANIWTNPDEIAGDGIDNDSNGKVDDTNGWDFIGNVTGQQFYSGQFDPDNETTPVHNSNTHGTHVSGCASAVTDNNVGVAGIGFNCKIMPIKCSADNVNPGSGGARGLLQTYEGMLYAAEMGAHIINASWGGSGYSPYSQDVINQINDMGTLVVVASGNNGDNIDNGGFYPAAYDNVLCVGATRSNNRRSGFSNYGQRVTVYSPGQNVYSTFPGNRYTNQSGTSMASPVLAGVAGLVRTLRPNWTPRQVIGQIRSTSDDVVAQTPENRPIEYGRVNAFKALSYNNPKFPGNFAYSVGIEEKIFFNGDFIGDYERKTVRFVIKSYLNNVSNLNVTISTLDNFIELGQTEYNLGTLNENATKEIDLSIELLENNPWFNGDATLLFTYEATGGYTDYELVSLPILIDSDNFFSHQFEVDEDYYALWFDAFARNKNKFFAVGMSQSNNQGILWTNGLNFLASAGTLPATAVHITDDNLIHMASSPLDGGNAYVQKSPDGGNWTPVNVGAITEFINGLHYFDNQKGVFLGDPKGGSWGVGTTDDGGATFKKSINVPVPNSGEAGIVGVTAMVGNKAFFGTNQGRFFYSDDKGFNWKVVNLKPGGLINAIGFAGPDTGMVVYQESSDNSLPKYGAFTKNGGVSFDRIVNLTDLGMNPVYIFSPEGSKRIMVLLSGGEIYETLDLGMHWQPVLSQESSIMSRGSAITEGTSEMRLWQAGRDLSYLDFEFMPDDPKKEISLISEPVMDYDSVEVGKNKSLEVVYQNTGNVSIEANYEFQYTNSDESEFGILIPPPNDVKPGKEITIKVRFAPKEEGERDAKLIIRSDAIPAKIEIELTGKGYTVINSVEEAEIVKNISINPNPASGEISIDYTALEPGQINIGIYDLAGIKAGEIFNGNISGNSGTITYNVSALPQGVYFLIIELDGTKHAKKFTITR